MRPAEPAILARSPDALWQGLPDVVQNRPLVGSAAMRFSALAQGLNAWASLVTIGADQRRLGLVGSENLLLADHAVPQIEGDGRTSQKGQGERAEEGRALLGMPGHHHLVSAEWPLNQNWQPNLSEVCWPHEREMTAR